MIKSILVSQPKPENGKSPFYDLADQMKIKVDFRHFIHVEGIPGQDFRQERIDLAEYTAIILTSKNAVDHYFRVAKEMRFDVPDSMKYFCKNEAVANYLQKHIVYRKRKIFFGKSFFADLMPTLLKNKDEKYLVPLSASSKDTVSALLDKNNLNFTVARMFKTVVSDLSDLADVNYDMLVFYSPSGIDSLFTNFPDFKQNNTKIAVWGEKTAAAVKSKELRIDVLAGTGKYTSMTTAIEQFVKEKKSK